MSRAWNRTRTGTRSRSRGPQLFRERDEAVDFLGKLTGGDKKAVEWAESIPLANSKELKSYH